MGVTRSTRRSFPFFKRELRVTLAEIESSKSVKEIAKNLRDFYKPEIENIFQPQNKQSLKNLRGRPEVSQGAELGREILLKIQGQAISEINQEKISFEATVETKFKEFLEGAIYYTVFSTLPDRMEFSDLEGLISSTTVEISKLEISLDYFENREFPFLGMKLQELKERFYVAFIDSQSGSGSKLDGVIENNNLQLSHGFSEKIEGKIGFLAQITGIPELSQLINE